MGVDIKHKTLVKISHYDLSGFQCSRCYSYFKWPQHLFSLILHKEFFTIFILRTYSISYPSIKSKRAPNGKTIGNETTDIMNKINIQGAITEISYFIDIAQGRISPNVTIIGIDTKKQLFAPLIQQAVWICRKQRQYW